MEEQGDNTHAGNRADERSPQEHRGRERRNGKDLQTSFSLSSTKREVASPSRYDRQGKVTGQLGANTPARARILNSFSPSRSTMSPTPSPSGSPAPLPTPTTGPSRWRPHLPASPSANNTEQPRRRGTHQLFPSGGVHTSHHHHPSSSSSFTPTQSVSLSSSVGHRGDQGESYSYSYSYSGDGSEGENMERDRAQGRSMPTQPPPSSVTLGMSPGSRRGSTAVDVGMGIGTEVVGRRQVLSSVESDVAAAKFLLVTRKETLAAARSQRLNEEEREKRRLLDVERKLEAQAMGLEKEAADISALEAQNGTLLAEKLCSLLAVAEYIVVAQSQQLHGEAAGGKEEKGGGEVETLVSLMAEADSKALALLVSRVRQETDTDIQSFVASPVFAERCRAVMTEQRRTFAEFISLVQGEARTECRRDAMNRLLSEQEATRIGAGGTQRPGGQGEKGRKEGRGLRAGRETLYHNEANNRDQETRQWRTEESQVSTQQRPRQGQRERDRERERDNNITRETRAEMGKEGSTKAQTTNTAPTQQQQTQQTQSDTTRQKRPKSNGPRSSIPSVPPSNSTPFTPSKTSRTPRQPKAQHTTNITNETARALSVPTGEQDRQRRATSTLKDKHTQPHTPQGRRLYQRQLVIGASHVGDNKNNRRPQTPPSPSPSPSPSMSHSDTPEDSPTPENHPRPQPSQDTDTKTVAERTLESARQRAAQRAKEILEEQRRKMKEAQEKDASRSKRLSELNAEIRRKNIEAATTASAVAVGIREKDKEKEKDKDREREREKEQSDIGGDSEREGEGSKDNGRAGYDQAQYLQERKLIAKRIADYKQKEEERRLEEETRKRRMFSDRDERLSVFKEKMKEKIQAVAEYGSSKELNAEDIQRFQRNIMKTRTAAYAGGDGFGLNMTPGGVGGGGGGGGGGGIGITPLSSATTAAFVTNTSAYNIAPTTSSNTPTPASNNQRGGWRSTSRPRSTSETSGPRPWKVTGTRTNNGSNTSEGGNKSQTAKDVRQVLLQDLAKYADNEINVGNLLREVEEEFLG